MNVQGTVIEYSDIYYQSCRYHSEGTKDLSLNRDQKCDPKLFHIHFHKCKRSLKECFFVLFCFLEIGSV